MLSSAFHSELRPERKIENIVGSFMTIESGLISNRSDRVKSQLNDSEVLYNNFKKK